MQFTRLRLQGFKSFVDPTDLAIKDGLTGIVGPNGCGKSNLLEAIRWVMGENRPTQMRGGGMEDVIFAGAASRGAKHFAEVTLFIDNSERRAPQMFNDEDELDILRRITRDIGSAYKVNGKDVRARDVALLFADAASGATSPSLVRQGRIAELINAKPQARRRVLEDAAGISGLHQRRHESHLKLNAAEANLARVDDVLEALASQKRNLERQAAAAAKYKEIGARLRTASTILACLKWQQSHERLQASERELALALANRASCETTRGEAQRVAARANSALEPLRKQENEAAALLQRLRIAQDTLASEEKAAEERIAQLAQEGEMLLEQKSREGRIEQDAMEALERIEAEETKINAEREGEDQAIADAQNHANEAAEALGRVEAEFDELRSQMAQEEGRAQTASRRYEEAVKRASKSESVMIRTAQDREEADEAALAARSTLEQSTGQLAQIEREAETAKTAHLAALSALDETSGEGEEDQAARAALAGSIAALRAEAKGLESRRRDIKTRPVLDDLTVTPGYELAIAAALDSDLEAPLADAGASGWHLARAGANEKLPDGCAPIASFVEAPKPLGARLSQIGVCDEASAQMIEALRPGQRLVSKAGDLWRWDGFVRLARDYVSASALRLEEGRRLREIGVQIDEEAARLLAIEDKIAKANERAREAHGALEAAKQAERASERALTDAIREKLSAQHAMERAEARAQMLASALRNREEEAKLARKELEEATKARIDPAGLNAKKASVEARRALVDEARATMLDARSALENLKEARSLRAHRLGEIKTERENWTKRLSDTGAHQSGLAARLLENANKAREAANIPGEIEEKRQRLEVDIASGESAHNEARDALAAGEAARARADGAAREADNALADIRELQGRSESENAAAKEESREATAFITEEYGEEPATLLEKLLEAEPTPPKREEIEAEINKLTARREAMGAVNLLADEDCKKVEAEYEALSADRAEIDAAITKLRQGINKLNKEGRARLLAAFDEVNTNFKRLFGVLFDGGNARLELEGSDDPLEAGLEIICQPPGKKLSLLSLLSGGEQTLTAIALIFAVFLTNPSPLCVLDEVDAPLDDANVTRFCDLLAEMAAGSKTRFLIITHHAITMSRMDRLYGVTMAEKGVSQLVSVDLGEAEKMVETA